MTRSEDIVGFISKKLGVESVEFTQGIEVAMWKHSPKLWGNIPYWREVSKMGCLQDTLNCSKEAQEILLKQEGHMILEGKANGISLMVKNYKDYLFNFDKELKEDFESLNRIDD